MRHAINTIYSDNIKVLLNALVTMLYNKLNLLLLFIVILRYFKVNTQNLQNKYSLAVESQLM